MTDAHPVRTLSLIVGAAFGAALGLIAPAGAHAQVNPIIAATTAPAYFAAPPYGYTPYGYPPPYGYGQPYPTYNPSLNPINQGGQNPNIPTQAGATQMNGLLGGSGQGGGGQGGGGQGGGGGQQGGSNGAGQLPTPDPSIDYSLLKDPNSEVYGRYGALQSKRGDIRQQVLAQAARGVGIRRGFAEETARLNAALDGEYGTTLDARYDFGPMMIDRAVVPPVITELRKLGERAGDRLIYLTLGAFEIVRPARLSLGPPSWRDYLYNAGVPPAPPPSAADLRFEGSADEGVWDVALDAGIQIGIEEARASFSANLDRLARDYDGMNRYHELARSGAVSLPVVRTASNALRIGSGGERAFVGEKVINLKVSPKFRATRPAAYR